MATRLLAVSDAAQRRFGVQRWPAMQAKFEQMVATSRRGLGDAAFTAAWAEGENLSLERATAAALTMLGGVATSVQSGGRARGNEDALSQREQGVLRLLVDGLSDKEIAATLGIARYTVSNHVSAIRDKLGVPSRAGAVALALRDRLV